MFNHQITEFMQFFTLFIQTQSEAPIQNGIDKDVANATQGVNELTFEEDEEEAFYTKDLPQHACRYIRHSL